MLQTTSEALKELGGSGPPTDLVNAREAGDAREVAYEWIRWIRHAMGEVEDTNGAATCPRALSGWLMYAPKQERRLTPLR